MENNVLSETRQIVPLTGRITSKKVQQVVEAIRRAHSSKVSVILYINSEGGDVAPALGLYRFLRDAGNVTGLVDQRAHSMAAVVLQGCRSRQAYADACLVIHDMKVTIQGTIMDIEKEVSGEIDRRKQMQRKIYAIFAERTGKSLNAIAEMCHASTTFSARNAKNFGLIDEVR